MSPTQRVAVVTGGGSGIGLATCTMLVTGGVYVFSLDRDQQEPRKGVRCLPCDVSNQQSVDAAVAAVQAETDHIDILVNNAGIGALGRIEENDLDEWRTVLDVNLLGAVRVISGFLSLLHAGSDAAIVNNCSVTASVGLTNRTLYSSSKGAIRALTLSLAADLVTDGIRVNCVEPGSVETPWVERRLETADDPDALRQELESFQPIGRLISADEVAFAICYLADPRSASSTGVRLVVDGGLSSLRL